MEMFIYKDSMGQSLEVSDEFSIYNPPESSPTESQPE